MGVQSFRVKIYKKRTNLTNEREQLNITINLETLSYLSELQLTKELTRQLELVKRLIKIGNRGNYRTIRDKRDNDIGNWRLHTVDDDGNKIVVYRELTNL